MMSGSVMRSAVVVLLAAFATTTFADEPATLREKQRAQEKARMLAADLVSCILDIQLRQLKENNLDELPI